MTVSLSIESSTLSIVRWLALRESDGMPSLWRADDILETFS